MAVLKVALLGDPVLRKKAVPVTSSMLKSPGFRRLVTNMAATMKEYDGAGLAGPQVRESLRVVVVGFEANPRYPDAPDFPLRVMVNPVVRPLPGPRVGFWEGCLSVPGLRGLVRRPGRVRVAYTAMDGRRRSFVAEGFGAVAVQHEVDHLDGRVYVDRLASSRHLAFDREYSRYIEPAGREDAG
jgi:peptide deformylase